jgi:hypothetical protein
VARTAATPFLKSTHQKLHRIQLNRSAQRSRRSAQVGQARPLERAGRMPGRRLCERINEAKAYSGGRTSHLVPVDHALQQRRADIVAVELGPRRSLRIRCAVPEWARDDDLVLAGGKVVGRCEVPSAGREELVGSVENGVQELGVGADRTTKGRIAELVLVLRWRPVLPIPQRLRTCEALMDESTQRTRTISMGTLIQPSGVLTPILACLSRI